MRESPVSNFETVLSLTFSFSARAAWVRQRFSRRALIPAPVIYGSIRIPPFVALSYHPGGEIAIYGW